MSYKVIRESGLYRQSNVDAPHTIVIAELRNEGPMKFVTWWHNKQDGGMYMGHYFKDRGSAAVDYLKRVQDEEADVRATGRRNPLNWKERKQLGEFAKRNRKGAKDFRDMPEFGKWFQGRAEAAEFIKSVYSDGEARRDRKGRFLKNPTPKKSQFITGYDSSDIADNQAKFLMEQDPTLTEKAALEQAYEDYDLYQWAWDDVKEALTGAMKEMTPGKWLNTYWKAEGRNMGWQHRSGHKFFKAENGEEMMRAIFPQTDLSFKATWGPFHKSIEFVVYHHDAPTGEFYSVRPATKKEIEDGNFY